MRIIREKDPAKEREKIRKKERKKRGNRRYGQSQLKHSRKGILSCMMAGLTTVIFAIILILAFLFKGESAAIIGSFGIFNVILSVIGLNMGLRGFRERDKNYITCKIGVGINGMIAGMLIAIFIRGLM